jgi:hypothetical protein
MKPKPARAKTSGFIAMMKLRIMLDSAEMILIRWLKYNILTDKILAQIKPSVTHNLIQYLTKSMQRNSFTLLCQTLLCLVTPIALADLTQAASLPTQSSFQSWMASFNHIQIGSTESPWALYLEAQTRLNQTPETARGNRLLLRTGLRYKLCPEWSLTVGHAWTPNFGPFRNENRLWQQAQYTHREGRWLWSSRTRLEQRWVEPRGTPSEGLVHRFREMVRLQYWLDNSSTTVPSPGHDIALNDISLTVWDEIFVTPNGYDQNRLFAGLNIGMSTKHRLEVGYLLLDLRSTTSTTPDLRGHTLGLIVFSEY